MTRKREIERVVRAVLFEELLGPSVVEDSDGKLDVDFSELTAVDKIDGPLTGGNPITSLLGTNLRLNSGQLEAYSQSLEYQDLGDYQPLLDSYWWMNPEISSTHDDANVYLNNDKIEWKVSSGSSETVSLNLHNIGFVANHPQGTTFEIVFDTSALFDLENNDVDPVLTFKLHDGGNNSITAEMDAANNTLTLITEAGGTTDQASLSVSIGEDNWERLKILVWDAPSTPQGHAEIQLVHEDGTTHSVEEDTDATFPSTTLDQFEVKTVGTDPLFTILDLRVIGSTSPT